MVSPSYNGWAKEFQNNGTKNAVNIGFLEFCAPVIKKEVIEVQLSFD